MSYKIMLIVFIALIFTSQSFSKDINVCIQLADVVSHFQDDYDQAVFANDNADSICADANSVETCKNDIKSELKNSSDFLEHAILNYKKAGCEI